jgi:membrane-associated phospholipid phosphatase
MTEQPSQAVESRSADIRSLEPPLRSTVRLRRTWLLAGTVLILLGLLLGLVVRGDRVFPGELFLLQWLHQPPSDALDRAAWWASRMGDSYTGLVAATLLGVLWCIWRSRPDLALFLAVASACRVFNTPLKWLFASERPPLELHAVIELADGLGYPSGHTSGAVLVYGALALAVPLALRSPVARWAVRIVCLALMLLIPWSRMRLGVHWPSDVAGGYLFGTGLMALLWSLWPCLSRRVAPHEVRRRDDGDPAGKVGSTER